MLSNSSNPIDQFISCFYFASKGDVNAQNTLSSLGSTIHEASRDQLSEISDSSAVGSLLFLCIGQPELSAVSGAIGLTADGILLLDSLVLGSKSGDMLPFAKDATFMVASFVVGKGMTKAAGAIGSKYLTISTANASVNFSLGKKAWSEVEKQIRREINNGTYGKIADQTAQVILLEAKNAYDAAQ